MSRKYPFGPITADTLVKSGAGKLFSLDICAIGATAGDLVTLRDGLTSGGTAREIFIVTAANENILKTWEDGKEFESGIYVDVTVAVAAKVNVSGDYR